MTDIKNWVKVTVFIFKENSYFAQNAVKRSISGPKIQKSYKSVQ